MKKPFRPRGFAVKKKSDAAAPLQSKSRPQPGGKSHPNPYTKPHAKSFSAVGPQQKAGPRADSKLTFPRGWRHIAGTHAIKELFLKRPKSVQVVLVQNNWKTSAELRELMETLEIKKIKFEEKTEAQLFQLCHSHQGAVALSNETPEFKYEELAWENHGLVVALDGVEDPHNLGAVMRTSWLMGVHGVIIPDDRAVGLTATVSKVACGGVEHVPIYRNNQFHKPFETLKQAGFWVYGLSHEAKKTIYDIKFPEKVIWVLGAEDKGLRTTTEKICDELVSIPQLSADASYNVSVSAALAIAETKRQWNLKK